jgi:hypothetical protein
MTTINQSSGQGALFELVARGVKDAYFVKANALIEKQKLQHK